MAKTIGELYSVEKEKNKEVDIEASLEKSIESFKKKHGYYPDTLQIRVESGIVEFDGLKVIVVTKDLSVGNFILLPVVKRQMRRFEGERIPV